MMWHTGRLAAFDLETTGTDVEHDRIVTGAVVGCGGFGAYVPLGWLADPGVEIPAEATAVHGISTEEARAAGEPAADVADQIADVLARWCGDGMALVGHNVPFDLTLLDRELRRYGREPLLDRLGDCPLHVIDTRVLDTHVLPYRRRPSADQGARQLITLAQTYGFGWDAKAAHSSDYDALMSARIAQRIGELAHMSRRYWPEDLRTARRPRFHELRDLSRAELHELQVRLAAEQAEGLQRHFRKNDPAAVVDGSWPLRPWVENTENKGVRA
ncbi:exonuclease domain-containing protein [Streptomyces sp. NPDC050538]|uniref:exonuclease domain-containing protein n=1 Tax=Streptomyces sp. NPDC050538 TaxID=3365627 RepID=UPI00379A10DC